MMASSLLGLFFILIYYCVKDLNAHITLLVFLIAFFTFLMGRMVLPLFYDISNLLFDIGGADFSKKTQVHMYVCLFLSLFSVFLGYKYVSLGNKKPNVRFSDKQTIAKIKSYSKRIIYFSYLFALVQILEKVYVVIKNGYTALYLDYESQLPYIFILIAGWFFHAFYIFLATLPTKKEAKIPIILYLSIATISIGSGQRGSFVLGFLFVIMYLFIRNTLRPGNSPWIGKKGIIGLLITLPALLVFLFLMVYIRSDNDSTFSTNFLISFFYQQGVSVEVIGYTYDYEKYFPTGKIYLLGEIVDYIKHNMFTRILFDTKVVEPQTVQHALEDNSLDAAITYIVKPYYYLNGGGLGGCFIAEAWKDFGYMGVCVVSCFYGLLIAKIPIWCRKNVWVSSVGLAMFNQIIFAPRAHAIKPFSIFLSVNVLLIYVFIYIVSKQKSSDYLELAET